MIKGRKSLHLGIDDPVQILFSLINTSWPALHAMEQLRLPLYTVFGPFGRLLSLTVLDLRLLIGG